MRRYWKRNGGEKELGLIVVQFQHNVQMGVSLNGGTPKSSLFNRVFHYKPSILGYPYFWKPPNVASPKMPKKDFIQNRHSDTLDSQIPPRPCLHFQPLEAWVADGRCPSKLVTLKFILNIYVSLSGSHIRLRTQTPNKPCVSHHSPSL